MTEYVPPQVAPVQAPPRTRSPRFANKLQGSGAPAAALLTALFATGSDWPFAAGLVAASFVLAAVLCRGVNVHTAQLPLMRHIRPVLGALIAMAGVLAFAPSDWRPLELMLLPLATMAGSVLVDGPLRRTYGRVRRIALVGPDPTADAVAAELRENNSRYELVGRISVGPADPSRRTRTLGTLDKTAQIVTEHGIDLLVLSPEIPRLPVFETLAESCLSLPVRLVDLNSFCERVFGHVPVRSINGAWFQYLMHPRFRQKAPAAKRVLDLLIAGAAGLVFLPLLALAALFIRRDGGPVFFSQVRIGEGGRPFRIHKLRTMSVSDSPAEWTTADDGRVTAIGRLLRRTHLDEMPQVLNVLRGEMSIVGPRPEQPGYVASLESTVPYYSRRHLIKPGITGWAQVRCGYAGSVEGSAWKLCHDLYYVKHRSFALDLVILGETLRTFFADRQYGGRVAPLATTTQPAQAPSEGLLAAS
jgi:exopolysaccharide biosynthesis polyprenyl glycosylphosphotransferase